MPRETVVWLALMAEEGEDGRPWFRVDTVYGGEGEDSRYPSAWSEAWQHLNGRREGLLIGRWRVMASISLPDEPPVVCASAAIESATTGASDDGE